MEPELVQRIKAVVSELAKIIVEIDPANDAEWDAHDKLTTAHKGLRGVEYSKLGQLRLPEKPVEAVPVPTVECSMCKGKGKVGENISDGMERLPCPQCKGTGEMPAQPDLPLSQETAEEFTRVITLQEDAVLHTHTDGSKDFLSLHYAGLYLGPFAEVCPPVDLLKKGVMLKLTLASVRQDRPGGEVVKVELAEPKDIADQHLAEQMEHDFEKIGEERDRLVNVEAEAAQATADNGSKPKRRGRKVKKSAVGLGFNTGDDESP